MLSTTRSTVHYIIKIKMKELNATFVQRVRSGRAKLIGYPLKIIRISYLKRNESHSN